MKTFSQLLKAVKEGAIYRLDRKSGNGSSIFLSWDSKEPDSILVESEGDPFYIAKKNGKTYAWWWEAQGSESRAIDWKLYSNVTLVAWNPTNCFGCCGCVYYDICIANGKEDY